MFISSPVFRISGRRSFGSLSASRFHDREKQALVQHKDSRSVDMSHMQNHHQRLDFRLSSSPSSAPPADAISSPFSSDCDMLLEKKQPMWGQCVQFSHFTQPRKELTLRQDGGIDASLLYGPWSNPYPHFIRAEHLRWWQQWKVVQWVDEMNRPPRPSLSLNRPVSLNRLRAPISYH